MKKDTKNNLKRETSSKALFLAGDKVTVDTIDLQTATDMGESKDAAIQKEKAALQEEVSHIRSYAVVFLMLLCMIFALAPFFRSHPVTKLIYVVSCSIEVICYLAIIALTRSVEAYRPKLVMVLMFVPAALAHPIGYFFGVFSVFAAIITLAIYITGLGDRKAGIFSYAYLSFGYLVMAVLIVTEVIPDHGLITGANLSLIEKIFLQIGLQVCLLVSIILALRHADQSALARKQLEEVTREMTKRQLLLEEARQRISGWIGGPGLYTNQVVGGYTLGSIIGRGSMGVVYEGRKQDSPQMVAVKLLHKSHSPSALRRFVQEAELASMASSPHIVRILHASQGDYKPPFIAMELLAGKDLEIVLQERQNLSMDEVLRLCSDVANGLQVAHDRGIVHRDLKPSNLFRATTKAGEYTWKILDFGVSKLLSPAKNSLPVADGSFVGTPSYMSPELVAGKVVGHLSDQYSLAVVIYRAVTGHSPFSQQNISNILYQVVNRMPARPSSLVDTNEQVDLVLAIGLSKQPKVRFPSVVEFAECFAAATKGELSKLWCDRASQVLSETPWVQEVGM